MEAAAKQEVFKFSSQQGHVKHKRLPFSNDEPQYTPLADGQQPSSKECRAEFHKI